MNYCKDCKFYEEDKKGRKGKIFKEMCLIELNKFSAYEEHILFPIIKNKKYDCKDYKRKKK